MIKKITTVATVSVLALSALAAFGAGSLTVTNLTLVIGNTNLDGQERVSLDGQASMGRTVNPATEELTVVMERVNPDSTRTEFYRATVPAGGLSETTAGNFVLNQRGRDASGIERFDVAITSASNYSFSLGDSGLNIPAADYSLVKILQKWIAFGGPLPEELTGTASMFTPNAGNTWNNNKSLIPTP